MNIRQYGGGPGCPGYAIGVESLAEGWFYRVRRDQAGQASAPRSRWLYAAGPFETEALALEAALAHVGRTGCGRSGEPGDLRGV